MVTRPTFMWVPVRGEFALLAHHVDLGRFTEIAVPVSGYTGHTSLQDALSQLLRGSVRVAMEYSPMAALPRASRVDGGTLELVRSLGVDVVSSADLVQFATQRWSQAQLQSHAMAARKLSEIVVESYQYIGQRLTGGVSELEVADFILRRFQEEGLETPDGPVVAVDHHSSDPHYLPTTATASRIVEGNWVLIDLWAREKADAAVFADITWVGYVGQALPQRHREVFDVVVGGRDAALGFLGNAIQSGEPPRGWEVDRVAREYIASRGYGQHFTHRLGHSLGLEVHGDAVNLDGWETHDTRQVIPGLGVTIKPGVYLPEFGVRSEIDVYISESGPQVTCTVQREVVLIG